MKQLTPLVALLVLTCACVTSPAAAPKPVAAPAEHAAKANFTVIPLANASATEVCDMISRLLRSNDPRPSPVILADARTNSLIVRWYDEEEFKVVRELIAKLDVKV